MTKKRFLTVFVFFALLFGGYNATNINAATVSVNSITDLEAQFAAATEDTTFELGSSFPTTLTETIDLKTSYTGTLTIDGKDKELTIAVNARHISLNNPSATTGTVVFQNLILKGNVALGTDGRPTTAGATASGMSLNSQNGNVKIIDSQFKNNYAGGGGAIFMDYNVAVEIDNSVFENNLASNHGGAISSGDNNSPRSLIINDSSFINNMGNTNGGYMGGAITLRMPTGVFTVSNSYFEGNATLNAGTGGGGGGAIAITGNQSLGAKTSIVDCYFKDNRAGVNNVNDETTDGGALYFFNMSAYASILIDGTTFDSNVASDDGGAILFQTNDSSTTQNKVIKVQNSTFYNNQALGKDNKNGISGGAIQMFKNGGSGTTEVTFTSTTFVNNSSKINVAGQTTQRGGAIASSGSSFFYPRSILNGTLFVNNKVLNVDGTPIAANEKYSNISGSNTNNNSVGVDNGTATTASIQTIFAGFTPTLQENSSTVKTGSTLSGQHIIPTVMIVPNTGTTGLADNVVTPANAATNDERDFDRSTGKADAGAVEIGWIKYNENQGTWTLPELTSYDGKVFYEGTSPEDKYQVGYINEKTTTISDTGLAREDYTFLGWDEDASATTPTYKVGDEITVTESKTLYAIWSKEAPKTYTVTYYGNTNTGGTAPVDSTGYLLNSNAIVEYKETLVKDGYTFAGWNTKANGSGTSYSEGATLVIDGNKELYAQWIKVPLTTNSITVIFDKNATSAKDGTITQQTLKKGNSIKAEGKAMGNPTRKGYKLVGWCTTTGECYGNKEEIVGSKFTENTKVNENIRVYAQWVKIEELPNTGVDTTLIGILTLLGFGLIGLRVKYKNS